MDHGIVITTGHFSPSAKTQAKAPGAKQVELVDGERLCDLLDEHGLGVIRTERIEVDRKVDREWLNKLLRNVARSPSRKPFAGSSGSCRERFSTSRRTAGDWLQPSCNLVAR